MPSGWEAVIGLEVHAQLKTESKLFSSAPHAFGAAPNTQTTEVDVGLPGVLPVLNEKAVELAVRLALALGCKVHPVSVFARKHYFYPDLPKGYQISQYEEPYCTDGAVPIELDGETRQIALTRIHMEEDAAKNIHDDAVTGGGVTHVDLNRAGAPLVEIVSTPTIHTPDEAGAYLRSLRQILRYLDVSDADLEKGQFRCDANVSVRRIGDTKLGTRTELKNLNSFRFVERAIASEIRRQVDLLEGGGTIEQQTMHWDDRAGVATPMRTKEQADDYRYFPDPDLPPLRVSPDTLERIRASLPELPQVRRARYCAELGIPSYDAAVLTEDRDVSEFFEAAVRACGQPKVVSNWIMRDVLATMTESGRALRELPITPAHLVDLLALVDAGRITAGSAREVFAEMAKTGERPEAIMRARGLEAVSDTGELERLARAVIDANPAQLAKYRAGETKLLNFFLGQVMKSSGGKADPAVLREILGRLLA
ncbi:MAG: Asp-tRNA(Asn)/Glu-tRNA(Gln) amidotransferase subunit GatB [Deltaproteobacteria bacterium]|nr:Asp-tRNA(Asn)/Glu-tRNA(Gln) amidotransferase subunit GatB [Deltaproteobacteria bacterium]